MKLLLSSGIFSVSSLCYSYFSSNSSRWAR